MWVSRAEIGSCSVSNLVKFMTLHILIVLPPLRVVYDFSDMVIIIYGTIQDEKCENYHKLLVVDQNSKLPFILYFFLFINV